MLVKWPQLAMDVLRHWSPTVWCDKDSMILHIQGCHVPNFLVETSECSLSTKHHNILRLSETPRLKDWCKA